MIWLRLTLMKMISMDYINGLYIDSTDIGNKNMTIKNTYKSFKLNKQAIRVIILGDDKRAPIDFSIDKAYKPDCELGY